MFVLLVAQTIKIIADCIRKTIKKNIKITRKFPTNFSLNSLHYILMFSSFFKLCIKPLGSLMTYMMSFTEGERKDAKKSNPDIKLMKVSLNK